MDCGSKIWISVVFAVLSVSHANATLHAVEGDRILDRLPAHDAIYVWTDDSHRLFKSIHQSMGIELEPFEQALQVPSEWLEGHEAFRPLDKESKRSSFEELVKLWDEPLFEGEAVWIHRYSEQVRSSVLILEAPADPERYDQLLEILNRLIDPLHATKPLKHRVVNEGTDQETEIFQLGMLPGFWAYHDGYFFWANKAQGLIDLLPFFESEPENGFRSLVEDRSFETVFRSIPQEKRRNALLSIYIPPEGMHLVSRLGFNQQRTNFAQVTSPVWLDVMQDIRAVGAVIGQVEDDTESDSAEFECHGFALTTFPRGPITDSLSKLEEDQWIPDMLPEEINSLISFGIEGDALSKRLPEMVDREKRLSHDLQSQMSHKMLGADNKETLLTFPKPLASDIQSLSGILENSDTMSMLGTDHDFRRTNMIALPTYRLLYFRAANAEMAQASLNSYIEQDTRVTIDAVGHIDSLRWERSTEGEQGFHSWEIPEQLQTEQDERSKKWIEAIRRSLTQFNRVSENDPDHEEKNRQGKQALLNSFKPTEQKLLNTTSMSWIQQGRWVLPIPVEKDLLPQLKNTSTEKIIDAQLRDVTSALQELDKMVTIDSNQIGVIAIWSQHLAMSLRLIDANSPEKELTNFFGPLRSFDENDKDLIQRGVVAQRKTQIAHELLQPLDRIVFSIHDGNKGFSFYGAAFRKEMLSQTLEK